MSAALDVPADLETAISAALGDSLDAILVSADSVDEALNLLEQGEGRAAILPLDANPNAAPFSVPDDPDCLGLGIRPRITPYALETLTGNSLISHAKAGEDLGYAPRPLCDSLADTIAWLRDNRHAIAGPASIR